MVRRVSGTEALGEQCLPFMTTETRTSLRARLGGPRDSARLKSIGELDEHCERILARAPFAVVATAGADGTCDASPRGGPPGFIRMLSPMQVAIGVLPGNRLFDGAQHLAENPHAALFVMVPGLPETLRIEGRTAVSTGQGAAGGDRHRRQAAVGRVVIEVDKAFLHCGKAFKRLPAVEA